MVETKLTYRLDCGPSASVLLCHITAADERLRSMAASKRQLRQYGGRYRDREKEDALKQFSKDGDGRDRLHFEQEQYPLRIVGWVSSGLQ